MFQLPVTSRAGSSAIDFTPLGDQKSIADDPALEIHPNSNQFAPMS